MAEKLIKNFDFGGISQGFGMTEFNEVLEAGYKAGARKSKWTKKTSFAPSGVGYGNGKCPRYWHYAFNGAEFDNSKNTALNIANMDNGTDSGKRLAKYLEQAGILVSTEAPVKNIDPPIGGFMDAMVTWKGEEVPVEIKTTRSETFNIRQSKMEAPGYQLIQLLIYMYVFKKPRGFFVIENKNTHELLVLPVRMTDQNKALIESVLEWMRTVHKNAQDPNSLPTRPFTKSSPSCKSCPVQATCWEGFDKGTKSREAKDPNPGVVDLPILEIPA